MPDMIDDVDEHPIIFNEWSIQRILAGEKTQTRRIVKGVGGGEGNGALPVIQRPGDTYDDGKWYARTRKTRSNGWDSYDDFDALVADHSPYGQPGDVLWVREAFRLPSEYDDMSPSTYRDEVGVDHRAVYFDADDTINGAEANVPEHSDQNNWEPYKDTFGRKRPSIHMPRAFCRLWLRVEDVRVERVQEISASDCAAEGILSNPSFKTDNPIANATKTTMRRRFKHKWRDIHGDDAWERNDWVWVIEFSRYDE